MDNTHTENEEIQPKAENSEPTTSESVLAPAKDSIELLSEAVLHNVESIEQSLEALNVAAIIDDKTKVQGSSDLVKNIEEKIYNKNNIFSDDNGVINVNASNSVVVADISVIDDALAKLNSEVLSLYETNSDANTSVPVDSISANLIEAAQDIATLDQAVANLNSEVQSFVKQEKNKCETGAVPKCDKLTALKADDNKYFDYSLYRESSTSPPPHPPNTYRWEDIKREKEKGGYPWTYLDPQEIEEAKAKRQLKLAEVLSKPIEETINDEEQPTSLNFGNIDIKIPDGFRGSKGSVKETSSGILEILTELEAEDEQKNELKSSTTQSHQDLSAGHEEEPKLPFFKSLLKRTHSLPKKIDITKAKTIQLEQSELSPVEVKCCHPFVEKIKTMADKQLHKKSSKNSKIKTISVSDTNKIVLAEQTKIIKLKDSPKADRKNVAAFLEKRDSDEIVEIIELDESPTETRRKREEDRKTEQQMIKNFVLPANVTQTIDTEPTIEELLEEEFKNDLPQKSPRKSKEHIYEDIQPVDDVPLITTVQSILINQNSNAFAEQEKKSLAQSESKPLDKEINESECTTNEKLVSVASKPVDIIQSTSLPNQKVQESINAPTLSNIQISVDQPDSNISDEQPKNNSDQIQSNLLEPRPKLETIGAEKKVKFSQSTEEYQEKIAAEKGSEKEDVELPEHLKPAKRWSEMSDHEYEPIGEPIITTVQIKSETILERPIVRVTEPEPISQPPNQFETETNTTINISYTPTDDPSLSADEDLHDSESPLRSITPFTDISRTEEIHTSQIDDSVIEELPLRREDRKKKSFMTNAGEHTKNLQHKLSSQASNLRTKFRKSMKSSPSGATLKSNLKSSPKTSQASPKERKKFKRPDFAAKFKSIHMPKIHRPGFKMPERFRMNRGTQESFEESANAEATHDTNDINDTFTVSTITTEEITTVKPTPKKRFDFGTTNIFNRFKTQSKDEPNDEVAVAESVAHETDEKETTNQPTSSFSARFATVPRTANKIKDSIKSKWAQTSFRSKDRSGSESQPQDIDRSREDSVERRVRLAAKMSMDDEEESLGILQTKERIELAKYDQENRAIHKISRARETVFKSRKPLVHQDSDLLSEESNRDLDWEECERMRTKILGQHKSHLPTHGIHEERRRRHDSNFSNEETQSSGSSDDRRRAGIIEDIDDDEFFLRQRGVSQDNVQISQYISSAIREGLAAPRNGLADLSYSDENFNDNNEHERYQYEDKPRKPFRKTDSFNKSFESSEDYNRDRDRDDFTGQSFEDFKFASYLARNKEIHDDDDVFDRDVPVASQYYPRNDDENILFYENEVMEGIEQPDIMITHPEYESDPENLPFEHRATPPEIPKRRRKGHSPAKKDSFNTKYPTPQEIIVYSYETPLENELSEMVKPIRKSRSSSLKTVATIDRRPTPDPEFSVLETHSPQQSRYKINIKETNGYATVKKEPPARPPPPVRRKRSIKSLGEESPHKSDAQRNAFDSPHPERPARNYNIIVPTRPPRRSSSNSLIDQSKAESIAASDITQYEEIDDIDLNESNLESVLHSKMQNRPLPAPPRPPRDKRHRRNKDTRKLQKNNSDEVSQQSFDNNSEFSARDLIDGTEISTQTDPLFDDDLDENVNSLSVSPDRYTRTVEELLRNSNVQRHNDLSNEDNLSKGIQKFRESNQRSYSERSRTSADRPKTPLSRPITPSALLIEQRVARSPIQTDATLIVQPVDKNKISDYRTDSAESEYVPYADEDPQIDTEDERIISAAIRRYQMLGNQLDEHSPSPPAILPTRSKTDKDNKSPEKSHIDRPLPPPRRKSSTSNLALEQLSVTLAQSETTLLSSNPDLDDFNEPLIANDLSIESLQTNRSDEDIIVPNLNVNVRAAAPINILDTGNDRSDLVVNDLEINSEIRQTIINREQLKNDTTKPENESKIQNEDVTKEKDTSATKEEETEERAPTPPSLPTNYTHPSDIPASFYQLRTGISDDESRPSPPPTQRHRSRKQPHHRRCESSSDEESHRRHHQHGRMPESTISELSGQLIRACGRAMHSSLNTAGNTLFDLLRGLTHSKDEKQKDLSLVLIIIIFIIASLMMLGMTGDRSVHHHHWDYLNPPDNTGRPS